MSRKRPFGEKASRQAAEMGRLAARAPQRKPRRLVIQQGEANGEAGAYLRSAVDLDRAIVIFDHFLRDVETEAGAALALLGREIRVENFCHLRRRNTGTGIFHADI